ncbi:MAG: pyrimidine/purine nucleoside phosphorylase [Prolixibacteraceae bacterium]|jgi:uncharacterized protein YaiE (UPF0345 family)|nr:pyrimidine/purine nucleoside phosphorylase [Prolixibacteraceae bacterium]
MFITNEYFEGNVVSIAYENKKGNAKLGVMAKGEYEFATTCIEFITVVSGEMSVLLPSTTVWETHVATDTFKVEKDENFN